MEWYLAILEYIKALVTWPVAVVVIVLLLRESLTGLIGRVVRVRVPGVHLDTNQQAETTASKPPPQTPAPPLPANLQITSQQQEELKQVFQAERAAARLWEYRYLNLFLALGTQLVLQWFTTTKVTTEDAYDAYWLQYIPDASQRKIIIQVLTGHHLVEVEGPALKVTEKGKEYVGWRGPLPPTGTPPPVAGAPVTPAFPFGG